MTYTVAALLAGYRDGRLDPATVAREFGADAPGAAERWAAGTPRALEGVPVLAMDEAARAFAAMHGAVVVSGSSAPLGLGGSAADVAAVARAGGCALLAPELSAMAAPRPDDLVTVLGALGHAAGQPARRVGRIAGLAGASDAARRADDLAASLLRGLGLDVTPLTVTGASRLAAAAPDADALLLPLTADLIEECTRAHLATVALPGSWGSGAHIGLILSGKNAKVVTTLASRLHGAMGS